MKLYSCATRATARLRRIGLHHEGRCVALALWYWKFEIISAWVIMPVGLIIGLFDSIDFQKGKLWQRQSIANLLLISDLVFSHVLNFHPTDIIFTGMFITNGNKRVIYTYPDDGLYYARWSTHWIYRTSLSWWEHLGGRSTNPHHGPLWSYTKTAPPPLEFFFELNDLFSLLFEVLLWCFDIKECLFRLSVWMELVY